MAVKVQDTQHIGPHGRQPVKLPEVQNTMHIGHHNHPECKPTPEEPAFPITPGVSLDMLALQGKDRTVSLTSQDKLIKEKAQEIKDAVDNIDIDTTTLAKEATLINKAADIIQAIAGIHIDIPDNIATEDDVTNAKQAILEALSQIQPEDPYSQALAAFFNITPPVPNAVPMTQQEVEDDLDELWNLIITQ